MSMPRQCVRQATCTDCDEDEDNLTVTDTDMDIEEDELTYETRCSCGETGSVTLDTEGIASVENLSHEDASWNQDEDEDSDD